MVGNNTQKRFGFGFVAKKMASSSDAAPDGGAPAAPGPKKKPTVVLLIGMAGAGKTTMFHRLNYHCASEGRTAYYVNLDPAVLSIPFTPHVDVRDTVDYREVMKVIITYLTDKKIVRAAQQSQVRGS